MSILGFKPNKQIILDNSLNLKGLKIQPENEIFGVLLENFKGFEFNSNPFNNINFLQKNSNFLQFKDFISQNSIFFHYFSLSLTYDTYVLKKIIYLYILES